MAAKNSIIASGFRITSFINHNCSRQILFLLLFLVSIFTRRVVIKTMVSSSYIALI